MLMRIRARNTLNVVGMLVSALVLCALVAAPALASEGEGCPNEQLRQESNVNPNTEKPFSTELPECRAYEQVSPVLKSGYPVGSSIDYVSPSVTSDAVTYMSFIGSFSEPQGFSLFNTYGASRSISDWATSSTVVSSSILPAGGALITTPDLSQIMACGSPAERNEPGTVMEFMCVFREPNGTWRSATPAYPQVGTSATGMSTTIIGASRDLSHVVFNLSSGNTIAHLLPEDATKSVNGNSISGLYEISGVGTSETRLTLVNVNNNDEPIGTSPPLLGNSLGRYKTQGTLQSPAGSSLHAISEDGSTIYFEATPTGGAQTVYARIDGISTVSISKPTAVNCAECQTSFAVPLPAEFQGASADGSKVFFTTEQELFAGKSGNNLYEYDFDAPTGGRVTLVSRGTSNAAVQGVLTNSDDGSHVYFVAQGVLTLTANALGQTAAEGADNLYAYERDTAHPAGYVDFVARLCSGEHASGTTVDSQCPTASTDKLLWTVESEGNGRESGRADVTPDGRYLIFDTYAHLASEDGNKAMALYRYDSQTGELGWVSHSVPGFAVPNQGDAAVIPARTIESDPIGVWPNASSLGRAIDEDGADVVFTTAEQLSPRDTNNAADTYLWHNGTVSLISDGIIATPSNGVLVPENSAIISQSGKDIYFVSTAKIVGQDIDELPDLYDVRVDGGFPAPKVVECAAEEAGQERGETCQGSPSGAPLFSVPGSASFTGGVNLSPPPVVTSTATSKSKPQSKRKSLTRAQKLAAALKSCRNLKVKKRRVACERRARRKYGGKAKKTSKSGRGR